ncbi:MAG: serine/threonine protein kinase [Polyangiaceae bacterium]|nr:serine/threonine protein kinase [Polyangiaceae bacterium]
MAPDNEFTIPAGTIVLDKYRVVETLGIGGMGLVVKAIHVTLATPVAIKFLLPQYTVSQEASRRFIREAQAASKIASEHIVRVFDTGSSHPHGPYIVMEFLQGDDLSRQLRAKGAFTIETAINFIVQACLALAEAHATGIVHRDIKPANLFMVENAEGPIIKVLDFGISKVVEQTSLEVTKTTAILGSGLYMSPEQMKSSKTVDHRTDVYALGVTLYELLTRTQPFTADSFAELAIKVNMEPPSDIRGFRPDIPPGLAQVIAVAYAKKAEERYQTVGEFAAALTPWAGPRTKMKIEALARREMRRSIGSLPKHLQLTSRPPGPGGVGAMSGVTTADDAPPSKRSFPPELLDPHPKIPPPPSLPTPSSMGMDTFGLSQKNRSDAMMQTSEQSVVSIDKRQKSGVSGMLGIGIALGAVLALGGAGFFLLRSGPAPRVPKPAGATALVGPAAHASATGTETSLPTNVEVVPTQQDTATTTTAAPSASPSDTGGAKTALPGRLPGTAATATASAAPTHTPTAEPTSPPTSVVTTAPSAPPPPPATTSPDAPCKMRDINGNLIDCP